MKKILIICLAFISAVTQVKADYNPMVVEGRKWTYYAEKHSYEWGITDTYLVNFVLNGTTAINGKTYANAYTYRDELDMGTMQPIAYLREDGGKVYVVKVYADEDINAQTEEVLYDYENPVNPEFSWKEEGEEYSVGEIRSEDGVNRRVYRMDAYELVEGIGPNCIGASLLNPTGTRPLSNYTLLSLESVKDADGKLIYKGIYYGKKPLEPSLVVEGKKWNMKYENPDKIGSYEYAYYLEGDTTISGMACKKLYSFNENNSGVVAYKAALYETVEGVGLFPEGSKIGYGLYDFRVSPDYDVNISTSFNSESKPCFMTYVDEQIVNCNGADWRCVHVKRKSDELIDYDAGWWIEGIGSELGLLNNAGFGAVGNTHFFESCELNGKIIFTMDAFRKEIYKPLVVEGRTWTYFASHYDGELGETGPEFLYNITIDGTTEIGGVTYHNAYRYKGDKLDKNATQPAAYLREDGKKVYAIMNTESDPEFMLGDYDDSETVLYDFEAPLNPQWVWSEEETVGVTEDRFVTEDAVSRRVWRTNTGLELIEGIGLNNYYSELLAPIYPLPTGGSAISTALAYVSDLYGNIIFKGINYGKKPYTPLVSRAQDEGLKFVYYAEGTRPTAGGTLQEEKYVYNIELKGQTQINGINYTNVYRYSNALASDAVPCAYVLEMDMVVYGRRNAAYKPDASGFDRNIAPQDCGGLTDEDAVLYDFKGARLTPVTEDGEWVESQTTVDGMDCLKWMFRLKGDDKYIRTWIEGIGVDDRFGDLVTPDYAPATGFDQTQPELHHVEKADGEIIYKGTAFGKWAGIEQVSGDTAKTVAGVRYYNLLGVESAEPFQGVNVVVTTYTDGTRQAHKVIR